MDSSKKDIGLPFSLFKKQVNSDFFAIIKSFPAEKKYVTCPPYLINYVRRMISFDENKWLRFVSMDAVGVSNDKADLIVISPDERTNVEQILRTFKNVPNFNKCLLIIPRITATVEQLFFLHNYTPVQTVPKNPKSEIYLQEFHYDFFAVDDDYFLLPCYHSFYQINIEKNYNDIYSSARALTKIQTVYGEIPSIVTIGQNALNTKILMEGLLKKTGSLATQHPLIDSLFLFDRACDLITPLASQLTFEGLVDEMVGINYGICEPNLQEKINFIFTEKVPIISDVRGIVLHKVLEPLNNLLNEMKIAKNPETQQKASSMTMEEFKKYALHLAGLARQEKELKQLMDMASTFLQQKGNSPLAKIIMDFEYSLISLDQSILPIAESVIQFFDDWKTALRLVLLQFVINNKEIHSYFTQTIINQFGEKGKELIKNLEALDLIKSDQKTAQQWRIYKDVFQLSPKEKNENDKLAETCDQVIPLMVRLLQLITSNDKTIQDKITQSGLPFTRTGSLPPPNPNKPRKIVVFFLGGVTVSEVNFIRTLGKKLTDNKFQFIVGSTDQININNFMDQLCPNIFTE